MDSETERIGKRFFTERNIHVPAVTTEQMREVDHIAMELTGPNLFQMMENAGRNLALLALETLGKNWEQAKVLVLAGSGGNGGGGICAARHLANRETHVTLCLAAPGGMGEVPAWQHKVYKSTSGKEVKPEELGSEPVDLILDALIGYSLQAAPRGIAAELIQWANGTNASIVSLDVPSGVDSTTGDARGDFMRAHSTMTLALPKTGLLPEKTGDLILADIGIPEQTYHRLGLNYVSPFGNRFRIPLTLH